MKKVAIIGTGRFGKVLYKLLKNDFAVSLFNSKNSKTEKQIKIIYENETIFFAVPISKFESIIKKHKRYFADHLLIDVLSVKVHSRSVLERQLKGRKTQAILTHPMFGPDSSKNGFEGLPIIIDKFKSNQKEFDFWKNFFVKKGLKVIEMTPEEHDRLAANTLGVAQFMGRLLGQFGLRSTPIDSLGTKKLLEVMNQACNDTWELFTDLQNLNPFTKSMRLRIGHAYDSLYNQLLPKRINKKYVIFGIQGGKGSFNEEAILDYTKKNRIKNFKIKYLFTSENVLKDLTDGNIDFGLFAIQNAVGGVVEESTHAMARYKFKIVEEFKILIRHFLMKRKDVQLKSIDTILAHSQNFRQCKNNLKVKYPKTKLLTGEGDLMDTAKAAQALLNGKISKNTAILGPKILADIYDFEIIEENMQDIKNNLTTFFLVSR